VGRGSDEKKLERTLWEGGDSGELTVIGETEMSTTMTEKKEQENGRASL
jgi:hypothetical protein